MSKDQYVGADSAKLDEIIRQAESRLEAQMTLGIAADQRAMTFASILMAGEAALIAWAITHGSADKGLPAILVLVGGVGLAAIIAMWSALPVAWEIPGNTPAAWIDDIAEGQDDLDSARAAMADFYADMIDQNARCMASNANYLRCSMVLMILTLVGAGIAAIVG